MKPTTIRDVHRWYPLLLLRDVRGRFARLRTAITAPVAHAPRRRTRRTPAPVQLVLF